MEKQNRTIVLTESQLGVIFKALDVYSRLGALQFEEALLFDFIVHNDLNGNVRDVTDKHFQSCRTYLANLLGYENYTGYWNLGIASKNVPDVCKIAYELEHDIGHFNYIKNGSKGVSVFSDEGLKLTKLPHMKILDNTNE